MLDLGSFDRGDYASALREKQECENLTSVLYPNDSTPEGRELRLKQQYFFACASLADIVGRFKRRFPHEPLANFSQYNAIQLNDTHPTICVAEMMRLLLDLEGLPWIEAEKIVFETFAYTNHTVLPEALEEWSLRMFRNLLPRHLEIIFEINQRFLDGPVAERWTGTNEMRSRLSIIKDDYHDPKVRMAHLACVGCHSINGVAAVHTELLKRNLLKGFYDLWPERFRNLTNGVTPRRWVMQCNIPLANLITKSLGSDDWITDFKLTQKLSERARDPQFQKEFRTCKHLAKERLRKLLIEQSVNQLLNQL